MQFESIQAILNDFIPLVEGFTSLPKWDFKQWSWGYGTAAGFDRDKRPKGIITKEQALSDSSKQWLKDFNILYPLIKKSLNPSQWAALLSFSYNEGIGSAEKLVDDINTNSPGLEAHWKEYVYAGGVKNGDLLARRNKEWKLWLENL